MSILDRLGIHFRSAQLDGIEVDASPGWLNRLGYFAGGRSSTGIVVSSKNALRVPAVFAAVNFISGTMAALPVHVMRKKKGGAEKVDGTLADLLSRAANDELTAFGWRQYMFHQVLTEGRGLTYIERNAAGNPVNLWPMSAKATEVKIDADLRKTYVYTIPGTNKRKVYEAADVIDIPFMISEDQKTHLSPLKEGAEAIGLALAAMQYGAKIFENGGLPPLILQGAFKSIDTAQRASDDLTKAMAKAYKQGRQAIALPVGFEAKALGFDPSEMQLVELQRWCVEQIARLYSLPPTFLQDLTNGTHSNTEQQDLHFVKHTLTRWIKQVEQELNLKLIGRGRRSSYVKFNVDGLLRGDFRTRMEGNAKAISTGQLTPNEARALEDREEKPGGDELYIQGALMPTRTQKDAKVGSAAQPKSDKGDGGDPDD